MIYIYLGTFQPRVETVFQIQSNKTKTSDCKLIDNPEVQNNYIFYCFDTLIGPTGILCHRLNVQMHNKHPDSTAVEVAEIKFYENRGIIIKTQFNFYKLLKRFFYCWQA